MVALCMLSLGSVAYAGFKIVIDFAQGLIKGKKLTVLAIGLLFSILYMAVRGDKSILCTWLIICAASA